MSAPCYFVVAPLLHWCQMVTYLVRRGAKRFKVADFLVFLLAVIKICQVCDGIM